MGNAGPCDRDWESRTASKSDGGKAWGVAIEKRFFHWFLEFPNIIARGGFDCIVGNPPYLGNRALEHFHK
jgi:hypothetical protein